MTPPNLFIGRRDRRSLSLLFILLVGLAGATPGCSPFSKPSLVQQSFAFQAIAPPLTNHPVASTRAVLGVRKVEVQSPFNTQSFVYRTGENSFEQDPYAQFLAPTGESLTSAIEESIRRSNVFAEVAEPGSLLNPQVVLEVYVTELYGDFRKSETPAAVLSARFVFFGPARGGQRTVLADHEYHERISLGARTAAALADGWNEALNHIIAQAVQDVPKAQTQ